MTGVGESSQDGLQVQVVFEKLTELMQRLVLLYLAVVLTWLVSNHELALTFNQEQFDFSDLKPLIFCDEHFSALLFLTCASCSPTHSCCGQMGLVFLLLG